MRALLLVLAVAAGAGSVVLHDLTAEARAGSAPDPRPAEVRSVALDGRSLPLSALRTALATRAGERIDATTLARDRQALTAVLVDRGYLVARVGEPRVTVDLEGRVYVTFPIEQGPRFRVREVRVTGATAAEAGVVTIGAGEIADASQIQRVRQALEHRLHARRREGAVSASLAPDVTAGLVDIDLAVAR